MGTTAQNGHRLVTKSPTQKTTRYPGVRSRESAERRHRGRPDISYIIDYRANGKRMREVVGWASEGMTRPLAAQIRSERMEAARHATRMGTAAIPAPLTLAEAWERYRRDWLMANGKNAKVCAHLIRHLQTLMPLRLQDITPYHLDTVMATMRRQGLAEQTIRHAVALVRRIMRRMAKWRLYSGPMPFEDVVLPRPNNTRERYLEPAEARALLAELKKRSRQTWLMALISLHCGLRFGEIARLRWDDVRPADRSLYIAESKNGSARHAVMTDEVAAALAALPRGAGTDLVFPTRGGGMMAAVSKAFFRAVEALGLNDAGEAITRADGTVERAKIRDARRRVVFHTLRHTYASWLAKGGQGQMIIADRLGHRSLAMTARYTHLMDESRRASAECISRAYHDGPPDNQR